MNERPVTERPLVLGVGNPLRGDDGAGPAVAARIRTDAPPHVDVAACDGDLVDIVDALDRRRRVILVDAAAPRGTPGRVERFDASASPLPAALDAGSTHGLGLAAALELLRVQQRLPSQVAVYAIEGEAFGPGAALTPAVADAVIAVAARVRAEAVASS